jgi:hypothetical protein
VRLIYFADRSDHRGDIVLREGMQNARRIFHKRLGAAGAIREQACDAGVD